MPMIEGDMLDEGERDDRDCIAVSAVWKRLAEWSAAQLVLGEEELPVVYGRVLVVRPGASVMQGQARCGGNVACSVCAGCLRRHRS